MVRRGWVQCVCLALLGGACSVYDEALPGPDAAPGAVAATSTQGSSATGSGSGSGGSGNGGSSDTGGGSASSTATTTSTGGGAGGAQGGSGGQTGEDGGAGAAGGSSTMTTQGAGGLAGSAGASGAGGSVGGSAGAGGAIEAGTPDGPCTPESEIQFCVRNRKNCGSTTAADNCGVSRTLDCGICGPLQMCAGGGTPNVCGAPPNLAQGGTVSASDPGITPEDMAKAFDNDVATKWYVGGVKTPWIAYAFAGAVVRTVTSYAVTSANDAPDRDPSGWELQGSNNGATWTTIDTRTGELFANRFQTNFYTCTNTTSYRRYRFLVTANNGSVDFQVDEIQLFGN